LRTPLLVIFFAACLVLLLACSNLTNLMLSRAADRIREFSVRAVLGAGRFRLVQQVMIESLVIALVGGAIGIILGRLGLNLLLTNLPRSVPGFLQFDINLQVLTPLVGIIALSGLTFGLTPAFAVRRKALGVSLRSDAVRMSPGKKQSLTRSSLVVLQIGLATVILAVTGLVMGSYLESRVHGLGVDTDHLLGQYLSLPKWGYPTPESRLTFFTDGVERLRNRPGIEAVAYISQAPAARNDSWTTLCTAETAANSEYPFLRSRIRVVSPGYFATAGIPLLAGRDLAASDTGERTRIGLVNRTLARTVWGDSDPVGRSFFWSREPDPERIVQVVGIVDDVRHGGPGEEAGPCFYIPLDPSTARSDGWLMVRSAGDPKAVAPVLRGTIRDLDPQLAMSAPRTIIELAQEKNWRTIIVTWILSVIAVFALLLALIGIVGVVACEVANRRHEFGIRLAMGADSRSILRNVMGRGGRMAGIGIAAGLVVTLVAMRFLSGFLGSAEFRDPFVYLVVVSFLLATTLLASYLPASRIGRIDPVEVLREE
jgi:putative ABC transport system permease protein